MCEKNQIEAKVKQVRERYPVGSRIRLIDMADDPCPIEKGAEGTVVLVDDIATIHVKWDNGRELGVIPGVDAFEPC